MVSASKLQASVGSWQLAVERKTQNEKRKTRNVKPFTLNFLIKI
jgi:hypothetical protein